MQLLKKDKKTTTKSNTAQKFNSSNVKKITEQKPSVQLLSIIIPSQRFFLNQNNNSVTKAFKKKEKKYWGKSPSKD